MPRPLTTMSAKPPVAKRKRRRSSPLSRVHAAARETDEIMCARPYTAGGHMDDPNVSSQLSRSSSLDAHVGSTAVAASGSTAVSSNIPNNNNGSNSNSDCSNPNDNNDSNFSSMTVTNASSQYHAHIGASPSLATTNATTAAMLHESLSEYDRNDDVGDTDHRAQGSNDEHHYRHSRDNNNNHEAYERDAELECHDDRVSHVRPDNGRSRSTSSTADNEGRRTVEMTSLNERRRAEDLTCEGVAAAESHSTHLCVRSNDGGRLHGDDHADEDEVATNGAHHSGHRVGRDEENHHTRGDGSNDCGGSGTDDNRSRLAAHSRRENLEELMRQRLRTVTPAIKELVDEVQKQVQASAEAEQQVNDLLRARAAARERVAEVSESRPSARAVDVARLNVGGELFVVPLSTLLSREPDSYFHVLFKTCRSVHIPVFTDEGGAVFIDRDPVVFRYILNYLRGYKHFQMLDEELLRKLKVDARYFQLNGLLETLNACEQGSELQFLPGPGVNPERNRLRVVYGVATVGDVLLVTGRHRIMFEIIKADYVGVGLVSDACVNTDQEFHKTPNCCIYYMSGVFYSNFPHHRKEENLERIESGNFVSILVDMDKGFVEFTLKNSTKLLSIGRARRLRFAVTMKLSSSVRIVPEEEASALASPRPTETLTVSPDSRALLSSMEVAP